MGSYTNYEYTVHPILGPYFSSQKVRSIRHKILYYQIFYQPKNNFIKNNNPGISTGGDEASPVLVAGGRLLHLGADGV